MEANLVSYRNIPFEWGVHDCALFAGEHLKALTDFDITHDFVGKYTDAEGAVAALKDAGYDNLLDLCQKNFPEVPVAFVRHGDVVILDGGDTGYAVAIVLGETIGVVTPNGYGIIRRTDKRIKTGFKIG
jgi:hypothetical protein